MCELFDMEKESLGNMEYLPQVRVSKEDFLSLSDLAGDMSIMDYMSKVIREHVAAQRRTCPHCEGELQLLERCISCQHLQAVSLEK